MKQDRGSASIYALGAVLLLAFMSVPVAVVAIGFALHRQAVLAADLSAIGGAQTSLDDEVLACSTAAKVAAANGAQLQTCELSGGALRVEVAISSSFSLLPEIRAKAMAGARPALSG